jgi:hypothetical protein
MDLIATTLKDLMANPRHRMRWQRSSEAATPSAHGMSDFRRLFLRVRRRPSAKRAESIGGIFNRQARS